MNDFDVIIIGSGPSGIAAATALFDAGITNIIVFEREDEVGGIPRHTHHKTFGTLTFKRPLSGPKFIAKIRERCENVQFETNATVTKLRKGVIEVATREGLKTVTARHIILATGARETPRHGRLTSGLRPRTVITTGALQQFVYTENIHPFAAPVIVGTELVSFSALWTLRTLGIKPVAMLEEKQRITTYRPARILARLMGVPVYLGVQITDIRADGITIANSNTHQDISCDGVIFSGKFVGDNNLARTSHLAFNPTQIPQVDQNWLSSDPSISVIGNAVHPADMGDQCYIEGMAAGQHVAHILGRESGGNIAKITHGAGIKMTTPSIVRGTASIDISLHVTKPFTGVLTVNQAGRVVYKKRRRCMPARRITLRNISIKGAADIHISLG